MAIAPNGIPYVLIHRIRDEEQIRDDEFLHDFATGRVPISVGMVAPGSRAGAAERPAQSRDPVGLSLECAAGRESR